MYVQDELTFDQHHEHKDQIYRMVLERIYPQSIAEYAIIPDGYGTILADEYPEIEDAVRVMKILNGLVLTYEDESFDEEDFCLADSNFFNLFTLPLVKGSPEDPFNTQNDLLISERMARKYFGEEDPIGKIIKTDLNEYIVSGVFEDLPSNTHMKFDFLGNIQSVPQIQQGDNWMGFNVYTYVKLVQGADPSALEKQFPEMVEKYAAGQVEAITGKTYSEYTAAGNGYNYYLQPLTSIHLTSDLEAEYKPNGSLTYIYIFISISIFILVIACINFMNLATARSTERAKEVGLRKVMGAVKGQLRKQFLAEAWVLSLISMVVAISLVWFLLADFNNLTQKNLDITFFIKGFTPLIIIAIVLFVGGLAGLYPAFFLSSFNPITVLKGRFGSSSKGSVLRNGLVVFQFCVSIVLIVGTVIIYRQMSFIREKELGFDREQVLVIEQTNILGQQYESFKNELQNLNAVARVGGVSSAFGQRGFFFGWQYRHGNSEEVITTRGMIGDDEMTEAFDMNIIAGRTFSKRTNDSLSIILNESAVEELELVDPVGYVIKSINPDPEQVREFTIIGVVEDFHFQSLRHEVRSLVILNKERFGPNNNNIVVKLNDGDYEKTISDIQAKWSAFTNNRPFGYYFLDEDVDAMYKAEQRSGKVFTSFTILAVIIACVGLFGLSAYTASQRTKEIGVRKVLGGSVSSMIILLSKDFTKLILIAFILAFPVSYFLMDWWLDGFMFHIKKDIGLIFLAGTIALLISWLTVSFQTIRAASLNPVKTLKDE
jgi:putative ABC transport system permease protein